MSNLFNIGDRVTVMRNSEYAFAGMSGTITSFFYYGYVDKRNNVKYYDYIIRFDSGSSYQVIEDDLELEEK